MTTKDTNGNGNRFFTYKHGFILVIGILLSVTAFTAKQIIAGNEGNLNNIKQHQEQYEIDNRKEHREIRANLAELTNNVTKISEQLSALVDLSDYRFNHVTQEQVECLDSDKEIKIELKKMNRIIQEIQDKIGK